jgi:N-acetylglutamate synthase/N-acetylornithine aminotransferase
MVAKESAQVRLNEFLIGTANPIDMQIVGLDGRAELLRHAVKRLDIPNPDKVVPSTSVIRERAQQQQMQMAQQQAQQAPQAGSGQELMDGAAVTDTFQPAAAP